MPLALFYDDDSLSNIIRLCKRFKPHNTIEVQVPGVHLASFIPLDQRRGDTGEVKCSRGGGDVKR